MISLPPRYFLGPISVLNDVLAHPNHPRALFANYVALVALAWQTDYRQTPTLTVDDLLDYLGLSRRQFYTQKSEMEARNWLRSDSPRPGCVRFKFPIDEGVSAENRTTSAENRTAAGVVVLKTEDFDFKNVSKPEQQQSSEGGSGGSAENRTAAENCTQAHDALAARSVSESVIVKLLDQFFPGEIMRHCQIYDWALEQNVATGQGYLVRSIQEDWEPPAGYVPPEERCEICGRAKTDHAQGCSARYTQGRYASFFEH
jgi:hypothetical protein